MSSIILLPDLCIKYIISYLNLNNKLNYLNSCNNLQHNKKLLTISLDKNDSKLYFDNINFYNNVNKYNNIKLTLISYNIPNIILKSNIIFISLSYCKFNINILKNIKNIKIIGCNNKNLSILKNANQISITDCYNIYNIDSLKNVSRLFITRCHNITNINKLNNNLLYLLDCDGIIDIDFINININKIFICLCKNFKNNNKLQTTKDIIIY